LIFFLSLRAFCSSVNSAAGVKIVMVCSIITGGTVFAGVNEDEDEDAEEDEEDADVVVEEALAVSTADFSSFLGSSFFSSFAVSARAREIAAESEGGRSGATTPAPTAGVEAEDAEDAIAALSAATSDVADDKDATGSAGVAPGRGGGTAAEAPGNAGGTRAEPPGSGGGTAEELPGNAGGTRSVLAADVVLEVSVRVMAGKLGAADDALESPAMPRTTIQVEIRDSRLKTIG
jgi:hypothetical protein